MRVIAGRLGGRRLVAPKGRSTRPTSDRVREALFSVLGGVSDLHVLDLYAGTGALGIEALSRGARRAVLVESSRQAIAVLTENLQALGLTGEACVIAQPVERAIDRIAKEGPFDLILIDPPYAALAEAASMVSRLVEAKRPGATDQSPLVAGSPRSPEVLASGGRLVLEHASRDSAPDLEGLGRVATRSYGEASFTLYERSGGG